MMTFVFVVSRVLGNAYANGQYLDEETLCTDQGVAEGAHVQLQVLGRSRCNTVSRQLHRIQHP